MEKRTLIQWDDSNILEVLIGIGKWDGESDDERIFYWMEDLTDYQVGYKNGDGWTIIQIEDERAVEPKWHTSRPTKVLNDQEVVIGTDWCDQRADFNLARVQFIELYNGAVEPYFHISFDEAWCYSVAAKELLSDSSYKQIYIPGGSGQTIVWLPIHLVK